MVRGLLGVWVEFTVSAFCRRADSRILGLGLRFLGIHAPLRFGTEHEGSLGLGSDET